MMKLTVVLAETFYSDENGEGKELIKNLKRIGFKFTKFNESRNGGDKSIWYCDNAKNNTKKIKFKNLSELRKFINLYGKCIIDLKNKTIIIYNGYIE